MLVIKERRLMPRSIEKLKSEPIVGNYYLVPCVLGKAFALMFHPHTKRHWWPVLRPPHEDSKYIERYKTYWKETEDGEWGQFDEIYYEADSSTQHHIHVDPRFAPSSFYTKWERTNNSWHNFIYFEKKTVKWRKMKCLREMPVQRLFTGFGQKFVDDYKDGKMKCGRCPHKGALLDSIPVVDGVITCPLHGLKFDCQTSECLTKSLR
jgi:hypothetical protein